MSATSKTVNLVDGQIELEKWHTGEGWRVNICAPNGKSSYIVLSDEREGKYFTSLFSDRFGRQVFHRACIEITAISSEEIYIQCWDSYFKDRTLFTVNLTGEQCNEVVAIMSGDTK